MPPENFENHTERSGIPVIEDLGSGVLIKLDEYGLSKEPTVQEEVKAGADAVSYTHLDVYKRQDQQMSVMSST